MAKLKVKKGKKYIHHNGLVYEVLLLTNEHSINTKKYPVTVVYQGSNGKIWSKSIKDFKKSFKKYKEEKEVVEVVNNSDNTQFKDSSCSLCSKEGEVIVYSTCGHSYVCKECEEQYIQDQFYYNSEGIYTSSIERVEYL